MTKKRPLKQSPLFLIKQFSQWQPREAYARLPRGVRGVYSLHKFRPKLKKYDVVYIGMAATGGGIRSRLRSHVASKQKDFTHFSLYQVWDNIPKEVIQELEGLFREIYRKDRRANRFNKQRTFKRMRPLVCKTLECWNERLIR